MAGGEQREAEQSKQLLLHAVITLPWSRETKIIDQCSINITFNLNKEAEF